MRRLLPVLAFVCSACQTPEPPSGMWTGYLTIAEGRELPFTADLALNSPDPHGAFLVSDERTAIPEVRRNGDSLIFEFSEYGAAIRTVWNGTSLEGRYFRYRSDTTSLPFKAFPSNRTPAAPRPSSIPGLAGRFVVLQGSPGRIDTTSRATFRMRGDSVFGTIVAPDGDLGLLAGVSSGDSVVLSRFTGWQLIQLVLRPEGASWTGQWYTRGLLPERFLLEPRPEASVASTDEELTRVADPRARFTFRGITPEGDTLTESDVRFRGKALIVDIMGTWCHNCLDEAPILQQIAAELRPKGLEVVSLGFELTDDATVGRRNLGMFRRRFGMTSTVLFCGSTDSTYTGPALHRQLKGFYAYPTTLFIDRAGRVRRVHVGFRGPGTGEEYQREVQGIAAKARELVEQ